MITVYGGQGNFQGSDISSLRAHKFLSSKSTVLKLLPPTEDAFIQHLKRASLATIVDKQAHRARPKVPTPQPPWPEHMSKSLSCSCNRNCSCARRSISCYIGCNCTGSPGKCSRTKLQEQMDSSTEPEDFESEFDE